MAAELISLSSEGDPRAAVRRAAKALADGALVAFPTETVYGLAANAANEDAIRRLRAARHDATDQPYTVHVARGEDCDAFVPRMASLGRRFMKKAWPGPLTLVVEVPDPTRAKIYPSLGPAGRAAIFGGGNVGLRCPDHSIATELLEAASVPIVATGANPPGQPAPTDAAVVHRQAGANIDLVLDAGPTRYKKPSSIVAINGDGYRLIRSGVLDERSIKRLANVNILFVCTGNTCRSPMAEGLARHLLAQGLLEGDRKWQIQSAGAWASLGSPATPEAIDAMRRLGVDISTHRSQPLTRDLIDWAAVIFAMSQTHLDQVLALDPHARDKVRRLDPEVDVEDPIGRSQEVYDQTARTIRRLLEARLKELAR